MTVNSFYVSLRHDRGKVLSSLVCVIVIAWIYLLAGAGIKMDMGGGQMMLMPPA